jgi:hypothetical protein
MMPELSPYSFVDRWSAVNKCAPAVSWLRMQANLGLAQGTLTVYARSLDCYLSACGEAGIDPVQANQGDIARWIHQLGGLSNATCNCGRSLSDSSTTISSRKASALGILSVGDAGGEAIKVRQSGDCSLSCTSSPGYRTTKTG